MRLRKTAGGDRIRPRLRPGAAVFLILAAMSFTMLFLSTRSFIINVKDVGLSAFSGLRGGIYSLTSFASRTVLAIKELSDLRREYQELTARAERYEQLERSASEVMRENRRLREQLGFSQTLRYRHIAAEFIGRDPDNLFSALVINKGKHSGVEADMPVIAWQGGAQALVGKVIQAGQFESLVMPVYDLSSFVSCRFAESRYEGITEGQGSADEPLIMRYVRKQARDEISRGDLITTSGLGSVYPAGIGVGRVRRAIYRDDETAMQVELDALIDFSKLEYVFVIGDGEEDDTRDDDHPDEGGGDEAADGPEGRTL